MLGWAVFWETRAKLCWEPTPTPPQPAGQLEQNHATGTTDGGLRGQTPRWLGRDPGKGLRRELTTQEVCGDRERLEKERDPVDVREERPAAIGRPAPVRGTPPTCPQEAEPSQLRIYWRKCNHIKT